MALTKKKEPILTLEEKLEQAMVPRVKHPYEVPQNWCWTTLGYLVETSKEKTTDFDNPNIKYVGLEHIAKDGGIIEHSFANEVKSLKNVFHIGQILYGKLRPYLNKHDVAEFEGICSTDILVFSVRSSALSQYVDYFLSQNYFIEYAVSKSKGINLPRISEKVVLDAICPLPPLAEQQRIVDRIEGLFSKLDEAKEKAQAVLDSFATRRASILHKAFTGDLTTKWRIEHKVDHNSWEYVSAENICEKIVCGKTPTEHISFQGDIPFLKVYNIVDNQVDFEANPQFIPHDIHAEKLRSSILKPNDVIMNIVGPPLRKIAIVPDTYPEWNMNQAIVRFRPLNRIDSRFLYYALMNPETLDDVIAATRGVVGQANISVSQARNLKIVLPSLAEQQEIVRILDSLLSKERKSKDAAKTVLEKIELTKKAILSCAFRGELGTNDPTEESSIELLRRLVRSEDKT